MDMGVATHGVNGYIYIYIYEYYPYQNPDSRRKRFYPYPKVSIVSDPFAPLLIWGWFHMTNPWRPGPTSGIDGLLYILCFLETELRATRGTYSVSSKQSKRKHPRATRSNVLARKWCSVGTQLLPPIWVRWAESNRKWVCSFAISQMGLIKSTYFIFFFIVRRRTTLGYRRSAVRVSEGRMYGAMRDGWRSKSLAVPPRGTTHRARACSNR